MRWRIEWIEGAISDLESISEHRAGS